MATQLKRAMIRKAVRFFGMLAVFVTLSYLFLFYTNNRAVSAPDSKTIAAGREKAIQWLVNNQSDVLAEVSPMLWWILSETERRYPDPRLTSLLQRYFQRYPTIRSGLWGPLFGERQMADIKVGWIADLPYYNQHFIYALHCAEGLARESEIIMRQNSASYCYHPIVFFRPACTTHQLIGLHFLRQRECTNVDTVVPRLQQDIVRQLTWDPRVVDIYLQRVMALRLTGAVNEIKPVWIRRILEHQRSDGGWANFVPLIPLGTEVAIGFSPKLISIGSATSSFHATVQGLYLLASMSGT
mgnify:CR=1 FL=1